MAAQVVPFWQDWLKHHERLRARRVPPLTALRP
jgi:hypothetical protein